MIKSIILFIKAHIVISLVTITVVVGTAICLPKFIKTNRLNKIVRENMHMLAKADGTISNDKFVSENKINTTSENTNSNIDKSEPLTFRIEEIQVERQNDLVAEGEPVNKVMSTEYVIVPSYDKDVSEWTDKEKEEYEKMLQKIAKMAKDKYDESVKSEEQNMAEVMKQLAQMEASYSKKYIFNLGHATILNGNMGMSCQSHEWRYNFYTKRYYGNYLEDRGLEEDLKWGGISKDEFRNIIYPDLLKKIEINKNDRLKTIGEVTKEVKKELEAEYQENLKNLNELYNFSN